MPMVIKLNWTIMLLLVGIAGGCARSDALRSTDDSATKPAEEAKLEDGQAENRGVTTASILPPKKQGKKTLSTLLAEMLVNNPDIAIAGAREKEQWFGVKLAEAAKNPNFDVSASAGPQHIFIPSSGGDAIRRDMTVSMRQTLYDFGVISNDIKRAERSYASATKARIAKAESVAQDVMDAFLDVKKFDELIAVTQKSIAAHQKILDLVSITAENGSGTMADVKRITAKLENAKSDLIDLTTRRGDAADVFKNLTDTEFGQIDDRAYSKLFGKVTELDAAAIEVNPDVQSINEEIESLKYQLASVKAGKMPVIALQGSVKAARNVNSAASSDEQFSTYAIATLRVPLYDGGVNDSQLGQIESRLEAAKLRLEKQKRDLLQQTENVKRLSQSGGDKAGSIEVRVNAAKKVADLYFEQFKTGGRTLFELLDAQSESYKSQSDLIQQAYERKTSILQALRIKGNLVRSILETSPPDIHIELDETASVSEPPPADFGLPGVRVQKP
ncbi:MAG: hypothetical protein RIR97_2019 [Pseudomonadota bacterium]